MRSYSTIDLYQRVGPNRETLTITSLHGEIAASSSKWSNVFQIYTRFESGPITFDNSKFWNGSEGISRVHFQTHYWKLVAITAACSVVAWVNFHFSLRTLLVVTTLVAVVLGLIGYTFR